MMISMNDMRGSGDVRRNRRAVAMVIALCCLCGSALETLAQNIDLRPRFVPGDVSYYRTSKEMEQGSVSAGEMSSSTMTTENGVGLRIVERRPGGLVDVEYTILYMVIDGGTKGNERHLDTRKPQSNVFDALEMTLAEVINRPIVLRVTAAGQLKEVLHHEVIVRTLPPNVRDILSPKSLGQQCRVFFSMQTAPEQVAVGTEWSDRVLRPSSFGGQFEDNTRYALKSVDDRTGIALVTMTSNTKLLAEKGSTRSAVQWEKAEKVGDIVWSVKEGHLIRSQSRAETVYKVLASDGSDSVVSVVRMLGTTRTERITLKAMRLNGGAG